MSSELSLSGSIDQLREKMLDGFAAIAESITSANDEAKNHEQRIGKLEVKNCLGLQMPVGVVV